MGADDDVGFINLIGHTLFKQLDVTLNDTLISDSSNSYAYRSLIETELSYGEAIKNSQLSLGLYTQDQAEEMDSLTQNEGLTTRKAYTNLSKSVTLITKPHSDIFFQDRYLLNGLDLKMKLIRNTDSFCLMASGQSRYKVVLEDISYFARKVKLNPSIQMKHIEQMDKQLKPAIYPIRRVAMKPINVPVGSLSLVEENLFSGQLPQKIVIGFVDSSAFEGSSEKNPFNFQHFGMNICQLVIDGKQVPASLASQTLRKMNRCAVASLCCNLRGRLSDLIVFVYPETTLITVILSWLSI